MASIAVLWRTCIATFKSILSSQSFGSEYEFLCTQLSVQGLRVRLWGESLGLQVQIDSPVDNGVFDRPEVQATVNRCISNIAYLLTEIEALRRKYEAKPRLEAPASESPKNEGGPSDTRRLTLSRPISNLRQRVRDNQKQKSFLAITKWAISDAKKFDEKIRMVKVLIDGLEDVARAATFTRTPALTGSRASVDNPPPYAEFEQSRRRSLQNQRITQPSGSLPNLPHDASLLAQYHVLRTFLAGLPPSSEPPRTQPREKLTRLSAVQLKELRIDVYDDLIRRQHHPTIVASLPPNASFHPKRNEARKKLSTLLPHRFRDLATDVMAELTRRYPNLEETPTTHSILPNATILRPSLANSQGPGNPLLDTPQAPRSLASRRMHRHECTGSPCNLVHLQTTPRTPPKAPVGLRTTRYPIDKTLSRIDEVATPLQSPAFTKHKAISSPSLISTFSASSNTPHPDHKPTSPRVEIFKCFRVRMDDPCSKVLAAALKKYNINASPESYALYVVYGNVERLMELDSKPLQVFKRLDKEGKKPLFMLRKIDLAGVLLPPPPPPLRRGCPSGPNVI